MGISTDQTGMHFKLAPAISYSAQEVFATMLGLELVPEGPYLDQGSQNGGDGVVSFVGLAGSWVGTGSVSCSAEFACRVSGRLLMEEFTAVNEEVLDAVAELTNMIVGNVKTTMEEELGTMGLSIPTVIFGRNFTTRSVGSHEWSVVPFGCDLGSGLTPASLVVQVCLAPRREAPVRAQTGAHPWSPLQPRAK